MDRAFDREGQLRMAIGGCREGKIGQGEKSASLADSSAVQMRGLHLHASFGVAVAHLEQRYASLFSELISLKEFLYGHESFSFLSQAPLRALFGVFNLEANRCQLVADLV